MKKIIRAKVYKKPKYNLTIGDKKLIRELSSMMMYGNDSSDVIRFKKFLSAKNNKYQKLLVSKSDN